MPLEPHEEKPENDYDGKARNDPSEKEEPEFAVAHQRSDRSVQSLMHLKRLIMRHQHESERQDRPFRHMWRPLLPLKYSDDSEQ